MLYEKQQQRRLQRDCSCYRRVSGEQEGSRHGAAQSEQRGTADSGVRVYPSLYSSIYRSGCKFADSIRHFGSEQGIILTLCLFYFGRLKRRGERRGRRLMWEETRKTKQRKKIENN